MGGFKKLAVWQAAHELVLELYQVTSALPASEKYGITSQVRRAAVSIPANIAEGCGKLGDREFARYLSISLGSATEVEYYLILMRDLNLVTHETSCRVQFRVQRVQAMLASLNRKVRRAASPLSQQPTASSQ